MYNPLRYAAAAHREYLKRYAANKKRILFLGMNPGPVRHGADRLFFGEVGHVRLARHLHPGSTSRSACIRSGRFQGFACQRSEVSGARLWGALAERYATPHCFFADCFVANYCPLVFMEQSWKKLHARQATRG